MIQNSLDAKQQSSQHRSQESAKVIYSWGSWTL